MSGFEKEGKKGLSLFGKPAGLVVLTWRGQGYSVLKHTQAHADGWSLITGGWGRGCGESGDARYANIGLRY